VFSIDRDLGSQHAVTLRTMYEFNLEVSKVTASRAQRGEQIGKMIGLYSDFVAEELLPTLMEQKDSESKLIDIFWTGDVLSTYETNMALLNDVLYACGSVSFILCYLTIHTRSPLLSSTAMIIALLSIPVAFVTSARLSGVVRVTGATFLSLFLITGLGADVVLVFVSFWNQSRFVCEPRDYAARTKYLYKHAGLACLATSMTTALSFFANLASVLKALREFGFFMGVCILVAYSLILISFPALMIINEKLRSAITGWNIEDDVLQANERGDQKERSYFQSFTTWYTEQVLARFRRGCLVVTLVALIVMIIWTAGVARVDGELPAMFPEGHNLRDGPKMNAKFARVDHIRVDSQANVCNIGDNFAQVHRSPWPTCVLNSCQLGLYDAVVQFHGNTASDGSSSCACFPVEDPSAVVNDGRVCHEASDGANLTLSSGFVGPEYIPDAFWTSNAWKDHVRHVLSQANGGVALDVEGTMQVTRWLNLSTMMQEHWESGAVRMATFMLAPSTTLMLSNESQASPYYDGKLCDASELCYCGAPACKLVGESLTTPYRNAALQSKLEVPAGPVPTPSVSLWFGARRLNESQLYDEIAQSTDLDNAFPSVGRTDLLPVQWSCRRLAATGTIDVAVVWGLRVSDSTPLLGPMPKDLWSFDPSFRPDVPSAQRHLYQFCRDLSANSALRIYSTSCWILQFRSWLKVGRGLFPVRPHSFKALLYGFMARGTLPSGSPIKDFMWIDAAGDLRATYFSFDVLMSYSSTPVSKALEFKDHWDTLVKNTNARAPGDADNAWHTCRLWIRAEAERAIISSTITTLVISLLCGFLGALSFTRFDVLLSLMVIVSVIGVTICLGFFMCVMMGWALGAVEVLGLIVFIGYSITYALHVAHKYREHSMSARGSNENKTNRRHAAVMYAMESMASAVVGSAVTTLGSSFFLFFCTMAIFVKLASVLFAVTFFAMVFSVVVLPAALLYIGPLGVCGCGAIGEMVDGAGDARTLKGRALGVEANQPFGLGHFEQPKSEVFIAPNCRLVAPKPALKFGKFSL